MYLGDNSNRTIIITGVRTLCNISFEKYGPAVSNVGYVYEYTRNLKGYARFYSI